MGAVFYAVVFGLLAWLAARILRSAFQRVVARKMADHADRTAVKFLAQLVRFAVYTLAVAAYAHFVPALAVLGAAGWASFSVVSVIVGFAAQNTLGNLIAGFSLLLYRPFKLGDRLQVMAPTGLETGMVESLTLGYTLLCTDENRRVVIPNSVIASQTIINLTANDSRLICSVPIGGLRAADIDAARGVLQAVAGTHPKAQAVRGCTVTQWSGAGVTLTLEVWCADALTAVTLKGDLLELAAKRFAAEGIRVAVPQSLLLLKGVSAAPPGSDAFLASRPVNRLAPSG